MGFRIDTAVTILKTVCGIEWDKWQYFFHLEEISNVALLLSLIVHDLILTIVTNYTNDRYQIIVDRGSSLT